jgi:hypothetical protein
MYDHDEFNIEEFKHDILRDLVHIMCQAGDIGDMVICTSNYKPAQIGYLFDKISDLKFSVSSIYESVSYMNRSTGEQDPSK